MSSNNYSVSDEGLVVKLEEIDVDAFCAYVKEHNGIILEADDDDEDIYAVIKWYLLENMQWEGGQGAICDKESYGNDICGEFMPIIKEVAYIDISVEADDWVMMRLPRYESLFSQAYVSEEELISEMKCLYGKFLPKDFNYKNRLVNLYGVAWG